MFKKKLIEAPLNYWEEKSYMMIIPKTANENLLKNALANLSASKEIKILENNYNAPKNCIILNIEYENTTYEVGLYTSGINVPGYYLNNAMFSDFEKESLLNANQALTIFMSFNDEIKKCYQLELKLAITMVPDYLGVLDESAEKMLAAKWIHSLTSSNVLPSSKYLYSIQAVTNSKNKIWLHTHGLNRCGLPELEILDSNQEQSQNHYNLINTYAMYLLDKPEKINPNYIGTYIGRLINDKPIVLTCAPWTESIKEYKKLDLGGIKDRTHSHNGKTSLIFLYQSEEDEKNKKLSKVSTYNDLWGKNPLLFFSDAETKRMKDLAIERFNYVKEYFKNKENDILIKVGLYSKKEEKYEHVWFELLEIKGNKFKAKLTQEPYYFDDIHEGYEAWFTKEDITDWLIYTKNFCANPDNVFLLEGAEE